MVALPFVYFTLLFLYSVRKQGFDVYAYLLLIFIISSFFSIMFVENNLYSQSSVPTYPIGIFAPISYCLLLTICLQPFKRFESNKLKTLTDNINMKRYNLVVYVFFGIFVLLLAISVTKIQDIAMAQNLASMRQDFYNGDQEDIWSHFQGLQRYLIAGISMIASSCRILIIFFFINIIYLKKSIWFNIMTLLGSMTSLILSLYIVDRSGFVMWIMLFGFIFVLFKTNLKFKHIKPYLLMALPLAVVIIAYLVLVTLSRFGEQQGGNAMDGVIVYAGQSFLNYCNFFNHLGFDAPFSLQPLFPLIYKLLGLPNYFEQCAIVEAYYHHGVSNFSTFLGCILSISGKTVMFLFVLFYIAVCNAFLNRKDKENISLKKLVLFLIVGIIPANGLFAYPYYNYAMTIVILIWLFFARFLTNKENIKILLPKK